jgi:hypothetical protein
MKALFSKFLTLNQRDLIKGLIMAFTGAIVGAIYPTIQNWVTGTDWSLKFDWHPIVKAGVAAAIAYIVRKFFSNSEDDFLKTEPKA